MNRNYRIDSFVSEDRPKGMRPCSAPNAVRITHLFQGGEESGLVATCSLHRSQHKNRDVAWAMMNLALEMSGLSPLDDI